jgi:nucleotide-binding universal stress UspA family protein
MYTIFIATDFSKAAENATKYAIGIAKKMQANLVLFNACGSDKAEQKVHERAINAECKRITAETHLNCMGIVSSDKGSDEILNAAKKNKASIIILGITDASRLKKGLLGSMIQKLIKTAKMPILAIPENAESNAITKLIVATGPTLPDTGLLEKLANLASIFNAQIQIVHVSTPKDNAISSLTKTEELIKASGYKNISAITLNGNDVAKELEDHVKSQKASMLIIVRKNLSFLHNILSGIAGKMTFISQVPLMVLNEEVYSIGSLGIKEEELLG